MPFPLPFVPTLSYKTGGRKFGAPRQNGRRHAGCDLIAPLGTPIFAIADGEVVEATNRVFYRGTKAIVVQHGDYLARYCEVSGYAEGITKGTKVAAGKVIAYVGKMFVDSMLHFELYKGSYGEGHLTVRHHPPFQRRADLQDPTAYLDKFLLDVQSTTRS
jgi:murein DD-endopeptidase MepM/ murein hydrolase activator NlpD